MSYCVNCGVELDASAKKCALCDTPIYNPNIKTPDNETTTPFSDIPIIPKEVKKRFIALIISFVILIPNLVCALLNLFFEPDNLWFIYLASTSLLLWIMFVFPFLTAKLRPYLMWGFDTLATALYVAVFYAKNLGGEKWYFGIAVPIIAIASLCVLYFIYWYRQRKRHWTSKILHFFIDLVITLSVSALCLYLNNRIIGCEILVIADICCVALVCFWLYANKSKKVRAWLAKKVFV